MFPSAADLNHLLSTFFAFFEGGGRVLLLKGLCVFWRDKLKKRKKRKERRHTHSITIYFPTLLECAGGRFLSLLLLLSTAATPRENKNKHNDDNNGRSAPRLGEISIHPVRSFPPLPPPLFKLSRKKSSSWTKNLQCIFVVPSPKMQS